MLGGPSHSQTLDHSNAPSSAHKHSDRAQAVRFAPNVEEIGISAASPQQTALENMRRDASMEASDVTPEQIQALTNSLRGANLQEQRLKSFSFHPVSLPASRVSSSSCLMLALCSLIL